MGTDIDAEPMVSDLGEFGLIDRIAARATAAGAPGVVLGIGDDAAILRPRPGEDYVVSTDTAVEDVHFAWTLHAARTVGRRVLVANLSDLAAMGARPVGFTCALSAPSDLPLRRFDQLLDGLMDVATAHACPLIGGNLARAEQTHVTLTVIGAVARGRALRRDALRPGDRLYVTGTLGASALALRRARRLARRTHHVATPRLVAGRALARMSGRRACIDLSDGLAGDLRHLAEASGVGIEVDVSKLPLPRGFARACAAEGIDPIELAVAGGEDYELLFGLPASGRGGAPTAAALARRLGVGVTEIGRATRTPGVRGLPDLGGFRHW